MGFVVAADDRWHDPEREAGVRQRRVEGTPVVETRVRIPNGDLVQRVWAVVAHGGVTVVEFFNDSPLPVAVAVDHPGILTGAAPTGQVPSGVDLPEGTRVLPVGHHATVRIGIAHDGRGAGALASDLPAMDEVVSGWRSIADRAGRYELPAGMSGTSAAEAIVAARCEWLLGMVSDPRIDPVSSLVECDHLVRMGERPDDLVPIVADAVSLIARSDHPGRGIAFAAAGRVLAAADEQRALRDLDRVIRRNPGIDDMPSGAAGVAAAMERRLVMSAGDAVDVLPEGIPQDWMLQGIEVFDVPTGRVGTVSFAVRWHGRRPAVIWERSGPDCLLRAPAIDPAWSSRDPRGEHLWAFEADEPAVP